MKTYEKIENEYGICVKMTTEDGVVSFIPNDLSNSDYQQYLKWVEEQNA